MAAPNADEMVALRKFRQAINEAGVELSEKRSRDMALLTWLRARELNIAKSLEMLQKHCEWRKLEDVDNVLTWTAPNGYDKIFPFEITGRGFEDEPVVVIPFGNWDVRKAVEAGDKPNWHRWIDQMFALTYGEMDKVNAKRKPGALPLTQCIIIVDFHNFGYRQLTALNSVQTILEAVMRFESNNPEILKAMYFVNAPRAFQILFGIIKPVLSARTLSKLEIYSHSPNKWKPAIQKYISEHQLPVYLGGTNPNSCKFFAKGYVFGIDGKSAGNGNANSGELVTTTIAAGKDLQIEYEVTQGNTILGWTFKIDSYDIGFSILFNSGKEVLAYKKYDRKQKGSLQCDSLGTYTVIFDNKFSQLRSKTIHYDISITEPEGELEQ